MGWDGGGPGSGGRGRVLAAFGRRREAKLDEEPMGEVEVPLSAVGPHSRPLCATITDRLSYSTSIVVDARAGGLGAEGVASGFWSE